VHLKI
jgi:hypothetical protein